MTQKKKSAFWDRGMSYLDNIKRYLTYGDGDCKITPLQQNLLDALLSNLSPHIRGQILLQLSQPFKISFYNDGKINPIYFKKSTLNADLIIQNPDYDDCLYNVEMFVDGQKQYASITFYKGRLFSFEFKKSSKFYKNKEIRFGAVKRGNSKQSMAVAIDRQEHGKYGRHATGEE
jgi:hypothetical protein